MQKTALVLGAGGFIGSHMVKRLKAENYWVRGVDLKHPEFSPTAADEFVVGDLRDVQFVRRIITKDSPEQCRNAGLIPAAFDEVYQFAADMGGAGYIFTGTHDADIMHNSATINLNVLSSIVSHPQKAYPKIFYSSSACIYPEHNQLDPDNPHCEESSAYPANPDSEYGWEKLFSERLYFSYARNYNLAVRVARYHNIYGPEGTWRGGKEKAPAAICRKVAESDGVVEIWGDGNQTRSFLYIDECIEATRRFMVSDFSGPVNIGSDEMVTINRLVEIAATVAQKEVAVRHITGPLGVRGRTSDNTVIAEKLGWAPNFPLQDGIRLTYEWIVSQHQTNQNA